MYPLPHPPSLRPKSGDGLEAKADAAAEADSSPDDPHAHAHSHSHAHAHAHSRTHAHASSSSSSADGPRRKPSLRSLAFCEGEGSSYATEAHGAGPGILFDLEENRCDILGLPLTPCVIPSPASHSPSPPSPPSPPVLLSFPPSRLSSLPLLSSPLLPDSPTATSRLSGKLAGGC